MCGPAAAMMAAGAAANYAGKRRSETAMARARAGERERQAALQAEGDAAWLDALNQSGAAPARDEMAASQARRAASEASLADQPIALPTMAAFGNRAVADEAARQDAIYGGRTEAMGAARRELDSFGDAMLGQGLARQRGAERIGSVSSMRRGSAAVLPIELQAGAARGQGLQTLGTILTTIGTGAAYGAAASGQSLTPWWDQLNQQPVIGQGFRVPSTAPAALGAGGLAPAPQLSMAQPYGLGLRIPPVVIR